MMIKLIATDLDGTLLNDKKEISAAFWQLQKTFAQKGITFVAASGRPYQSMLADFRQISDEMYFITDNGSYIVRRGQELYADPLPKTGLTEFLKTCRKLTGAFPVFCGKDIAYMEPNDPDVLQNALQYYREYEIVDNLDAVDATILKVSICDLHGAEANSYPLFRSFEPQYKVVVSGNIWVDITQPHANKGNALQLLQQRLGIHPDETLVFGDYMNDIEMMRAATYSYAMKNAHDTVLQAAAYVTGYDNNNQGVERTIAQYL